MEISAEKTGRKIVGHCSRSNQSRKEEEEEQKRRRNLIVHRAPEPKSESWEGRKQEDKQFVDELMEVLEITTEILDIRRLGRRPQQQQEQQTSQAASNKTDDVSRPLLLSFSSEQEVKKVQDSLKHLKNADEKMYRLRITPDMTQNQREEVRKLVTDAKNMTAQEKGEFVYVVRGTEIKKVKRRKPLSSTEEA